MVRRFVDVTYNKEDGFTLRIKPEAFDAVPEPAKEHFRAASREALLAVRSLVDQMITRTEEKPASRRPRKVEVKEG